MLNQAQLRKYRAEWGNARKAMRAMGIAPKDADAKRMQIHSRVGALDKAGKPKSSLALNNTEMTAILGEFWSWSAATDLDKQSHVVNQPAIRCRWVCRHIMTLTNQAAPDTFAMENADAYIDGLFKKLNKDCPSDPDFAGEDSWYKVQAALTYRYDQIFRARIGAKGKNPRAFARQGAKRAVQWHPHSHQDNMEYLRQRFPETPIPEPVYAGPSTDEDPF